jgi:cytochrome c oxidase subunit II
MRAFRLALAAGTSALPWATLAEPLPERGYGLPRDVSLDGHRIDSLIHFTIAATALVFVIVFAVLLFIALRHGRGHEARYVHGDTWRAALLVLGCVGAIFVVVDGYLLVHALHDLDDYFWNFSGSEANPAAIRIEVNAHQWAWTVRYPGPDGRFNTEDDIVTTNDVRVPVGVPVIVQLASTDVIHSFNLPNFRVKQDAVPGSITRVQFQAEKPGEYEIACAQHCGPNHYKMRGVLTALAPEAYRSWFETAAADARRGYDPDDKDAHWGWEWRRF